MLCANRPEGFVCTVRGIVTEYLANLEQGPLSRLYSHILTSCFLDTVLVPLCTWLYLAVLIALAITGGTLFHRKSPSALRGRRFRDGKTTQEVGINQLDMGDKIGRRTKTHKALLILYYLFILAQTLMCILEIVRLSLTHLGIGLLPFTLVALITAAAVRFTKGLQGRIYAWSYLNLALWVSLAVTNGVKISEETKVLERAANTQ